MKTYLGVSFHSGSHVQTFIMALVGVSDIPGLPNQAHSHYKTFFAYKLTRESSKLGNCYQSGQGSAAGVYEPGGLYWLVGETSYINTTFILFLYFPNLIQFMIHLARDTMETT